MSNVTRHLQTVGLHIAKLANDVVIGDVLVWNGGSVSRAVAVRDASPAFVEITEETADGKRWPARRFKKSRAIAWSPKMTAQGRLA